MTKNILFAHAKKIKGKPIQTIGHRTTFKVDVCGDSLRVLTELNKRVSISKEAIETGLDIYLRHNSFITTDYRKIGCASYLLALIRDASKPGKV